MVSNVRERLEKASRRAAIGSGLALTLVLSSLVFLTFQNQSVQRQVEDKKAELSSLSIKYSELDGQVKGKQAELARLQQDVESLKAQKQAVQLALVQVAKNAPNAQKGIEEAVAKNPMVAAAVPRLYVQYSDPAILEPLKQACDTLRRQGIVVPPYERVSADRIPKHNEVRFFSVAGTVDANNIASVLKLNGIKAKPRLVKSSRGRAGLYELWVSEASR